MEICFVTASIGRFDAIAGYSFELPPNIKMVAVVDSCDVGNVPEPWSAIAWESLDISIGRSTPRLVARFIKVKGYRDIVGNARCVVWIDAKAAFRSSNAFFELCEWIDSDKPTFSAWEHPVRNHWLQEAKAAISRGGGAIPKELQCQIKHYRESGYSSVKGLWETSLVVRGLDSAKLKNLENRWWDDIINFSLRDQVSLPIAASQSGIDIQSLPWAYEGEKAGILHRFISRAHKISALVKLVKRIGLRRRAGAQHQNHLVSVSQSHD